MTYHPDYHPKLILWIARWGLSEDEVALELEIPPATLLTWKQTYPEVAEALLRAKQYFDELAESSFHKLVKGYTVEENEVVVDEVAGRQRRRVRRTVRHVPPNAQAVIFQLEKRPLFKLFKGEDLELFRKQ